MARSLSIVIPAFNEEQAIGGILERVQRAGDALAARGLVETVEICVVDDGSTDRTAQIVGSRPGVRLIRHEVNRGYGAALKTGFREARGEWLAFLDADASYRPESIAELLPPLVEGRADLVVGSRMTHPESRMPRIRRVGNWIFARLLSWLAGHPITDSASGLRAFRAAVLPRLLPLPDGLSFTPAMSARALHEGIRTLEIPVPYDMRQGRSKLSVVKDGVRFTSSMFSISRLYNPLKLFGVIGGTVLLVAAWLAADPVLYYLQVRRVESTEIYRLFTVMVLLVAGTNVITFGAFCNQVLGILHPGRPRQESVWAKVLMRPLAVRSMGWVGAGMILGAALLNWDTIRQYVMTGKIYVHWSYILTGATLVLVGMQLIMCRFFILVLSELSDPPLRRSDGGHLEAQQAHWRKAAYRGPSHPVARAFALPKLGWIRRHVELEGRSILDVGCGNGVFSVPLAEVASRLVAIDYSAEFLRDNPVRPAVRGVAERLPFPDAAFDVVFCSNLLHHVEHPERVVREMSRVARDYVILLEPNSRNPVMWLFSVLVKAERGGLQMTTEFLDRCLRAAGVECCALAAMGMISQNNTPAVLVPWLRRFDREIWWGEYLVAVGAVSRGRKASGGGPSDAEGQLLPSASEGAP
jgi:SAM-dependent methyltransferase